MDWLNTMDIDAANSDPKSERYEVELRRNVRIPTTDPAVTLSADLYLPVAAGRCPALVSVIPYRTDIFGGRGYHQPLHWFAERGYAGLIVNLRGVGASGGAQRPRLDPGEGDDAVAAIEWAAAQPWCTGNVGMWGFSYGGAMTMRAASLQPPSLKAIIPISCSLSPERYGTERGDLGLLAQWGGQMLVEQLLPPLIDTASVAQQDRWRDRLHDADPLILDMARHKPGDPDWIRREIDPRTITIPALCVGGWQDAYPGTVTRFYEQLSGPKKLLMGPWVHTMPQDSAFDAIDFLPIALGWWDHWLRGIGRGVADEPLVTLYEFGEVPRWKSYKSWPPPMSGEFLLRTRGDRLLRLPDSSESADSVSTEIVGEYRSDPTTGALSGLGGETSGIGLPLDQHDDDCRALSVTSEPLDEELLICGRPTVEIRFSADHDESIGSLTRIVVRITDVDSNGRSRMITSGRARPTIARQTHQVTLQPTNYRVAAGHRLRVVVSDSDFPLLMPLPNLQTIHVGQIAVTLPTVEDSEGEPAVIAEIESIAGPHAEGANRWTITRDPVNDAIEVVVGSTIQGRSSDQMRQVERRSEARAVVSRAAPEAALVTGVHSMTTQMDTGETVVATANVRCTQTAIWVRGKVTVDGFTAVSRSWSIWLKDIE